MAEPVFRGYDQAALDWEYDNRRKVDDAMTYVAAYTDDSAATRAVMSGRFGGAFGSRAEETLDIFPPQNPGPGPAPIHVFIHGGYWRAMSKDEFSYVARAFSPAGAVTVVVNYALVPEVDFDEVVRQCRAALAWTWKSADDFGGDRERICVSGHSAGGHLTAMLLATDWPGFDPDLPAAPIHAACGISGLYDLEPISLCFLNEDLHLTPEVVRRNSPVLLTPQVQVPLLLTVGGLEGPEYLRQTCDLAAAWGQQGVDVTVRVLPDMHHFSIVAQLNEPGSDLARLLQAQLGVG